MKIIGLQKQYYLILKMLRILDLRSIEYYKIKHGVLQKTPNKYFGFETAVILCEQFNIL